MPSKRLPQRSVRRSVPGELIERRIYLIRGMKVMLSGDLAELYRVEPRSLGQAVKRNKSRFPRDFMFHLTTDEFAILKSQTVISSWGGARSTPLAFTEQGVAMLSTVLRSGRAIQVNIAIMRAFVKLRQILAENREIARKIEDLERRHDQHDRQFDAVFTAIGRLLKPAELPKRRIGFVSKG